jgi:hypothetical protein
VDASLSGLSVPWAVVSVSMASLAADLTPGMFDEVAL